jgi:peptidoglycan/xylan/chitin deacetylase (PgdA/CDA1 family)
VARDQVVNICFHGIGNPDRDLEPGEDHYWVGHDQFLLLLDEVSTWPSVAISFDDGNASDVTSGLPALVERGLQATFFPLAGRLGHRGSLGVADLRELANHGMRIGTHGMSHRPWRHLDATSQHQEFVEARAALQQASGHQIDEAALPLGRYDRQVLSMLRRLGYTRVHTSDRRPARREAWLQPRFSVHHDETASSLRERVLAPPRPLRRTALEATALVKRWR